MDDFHALDEFVMVEDEALIGAPLGVNDRSRVAASDFTMGVALGTETGRKKVLEVES
jgi:hypothetical protein